MKDEVKGKEEIKGNVTGDRSEEMKGKVRQTADKAQRTVRDIREDVRKKPTGTVSARPRAGGQGRARIIASTTEPALIR